MFLHPERQNDFQTAVLNFLLTSHNIVTFKETAWRVILKLCRNQTLLPTRLQNFICQSECLCGYSQKWSFGTFTASVDL